MLQQAAVLALVDKEARLLSLEPVDVEAQAVLQGLVGLHVPDDVIVHRVEVGHIGQGGLALVIDVVHTRQFGQCLGNGVAGKVHAGRVGLHHGRGAIDVDYQARQEIALAVYQTVGVVVVALQSQCLTHAVSVVEPLLIEGLVDGRVVKREHPHGNAAYLAMAVADEFAVVGIDRHQVALHDVVVGSRNGPREHPGMEALE